MNNRVEEVSVADRLIALLEREAQKVLSNPELPDYEIDPRAIAEAINLLLELQPPDTQQNNAPGKNFSSPGTSFSSSNIEANVQSNQNINNNSKDFDNVSGKRLSLFDDDRVQEKVNSEKTILFNKIRNSSIQIEEKFSLNSHYPNKQKRWEYLVCNIQDAVNILGVSLRDSNFSQYENSLAHFFNQGKEVGKTILSKKNNLSYYNKVWERNLYRAYTDKKVFKKVSYIPKRNMNIHISIDGSFSMEELTTLNILGEDVKITKYNASIHYISYLRGLFDTNVNIVCDIRMQRHKDDIFVIRQNLKNIEDVKKLLGIIPVGNTPEAILFPKKNNVDYFIYISDGIPTYDIDEQYAHLYDVGKKGNYAILMFDKNYFDGEDNYAQRYVDTYNKQYDVCIFDHTKLYEIFNSIFTKEFTVRV